MSATELYRAGRLADALAAQLEAVKADPADHGKRLFLFELAVFAGDLDRAGRQLAAIKYDEPELQAATVQYARLTETERTRRRFFAEGVRPTVVGTPPDHVRLRLEAADLLRAGDTAGAAERLAEANAAPVPTARINDGPPVEVRDGDDLFGPCLEVMSGGNYFWLAVEQIDAITLGPPRFPRDIYWAPARLEAGGTTADVFLPALYPGSHEAAADDLKLGRQTDWSGETPPVRGTGGKLWLAGDDPVGLLEWRTFTRG